MNELLATISPDQFTDKAIGWLFAAIVVIGVAFALVRYGKDLYDEYFGD
jgi:hypothetical protein